MKRKSAPPETLEQALRWDKTKLRYLRAGLCETCAAQAAYGHQSHSGGWLSLNPPCGKCAPLVSEFPLATTNPVWRKALRSGGIPTGSVAHQRAAQRPQEPSHLAVAA